MEDLSHFTVCRKIFNSSIFQDSELFKLAIYLIGKARYKDGYVSIKTGKGNSLVKLEVGQLIFGQKKFSEVLNCAEKTAYNRLKNLQKLGFVTTQNMKHYTLVTVVNYEFYQNKKEFNDKSYYPMTEAMTDATAEATTESMTDATALTNTTKNKDNNINKVNKENKDNKYIIIAEEIFDEYKNLCTKIKQYVKFSDSLKDGIVKQLKNGNTKEDFVSIFKLINNNSHYQGENDKCKKYGLENILTKEGFKKWKCKAENDTVKTDCVKTKTALNESNDMSFEEWKRMHVPKSW